ncbi:DnaJ-domain-containing protein [Nadsonia fulvescens var. elongata DSM 6958]|uniref:DnaJ-domain-containing protein n=1 Tax=Nadsonia fulvescens var. elongata DSM 6958 TaxID=857566 RepID=A0A1E3PDR2_9ASCO|nr:DnaJ-domain-containing protein [Nadsonia fulvescens var. elongata DSM 6958]
MSERAHNQGRQGREFTPAQKAAVDRVKRCKAHQYYSILDLEVSASDGEIKKAYRKLALIMHPDKNGAPGADEAFKLVSKAFQILSDPQKKRIFDQTGSDPDSRGMGGAGPSGFSRGSSSGMSGGGFQGGPEVSADDLFNMFFGGGGGAAGFGGPNIRVHTFGAGGSPFDAFNAFSQARAGQGARQGAAPNQAQEPFSLRHLMQLLPLLLLFFAPMITSLFSSSSESTSGLYNYRFSRDPPFTVEKYTPRYRIPFYVREDDPKLDKRRLNQMGSRAEVQYVQNLQNKCDREYDYKQRKIAESHGWLFVDQQKYDEAMGIKLQSCDKLKSFGIRTNVL